MKEEAENPSYALPRPRATKRRRRRISYELWLLSTFLIVALLSLLLSSTSSSHDGIIQNSNAANALLFLTPRRTHTWKARAIRTVTVSRGGCVRDETGTNRSREANLKEGKNSLTSTSATATDDEENNNPSSSSSDNPISNNNTHNQKGHQQELRQNEFTACSTSENGGHYRDEFGLKVQANWGHLGSNRTQLVLRVLEAVEDGHNCSMEDYMAALEYLCQSYEAEGASFVFKDMQSRFEKIPKEAYSLVVEAFEKQGKYEQAEAHLQAMMEAYPKLPPGNFSALQLDLPQTKSDMMKQLSNYLKRKMKVSNSSANTGSASTSEAAASSKRGKAAAVATTTKAMEAEFDDHDVTETVDDVRVCNRLPGVRIRTNLPTSKFAFQVHLAHTCNIFPITAGNGIVGFEDIMHAAMETRPPALAKAAIEEAVNTLILLYSMLTNNSTGGGLRSIRSSLPYSANIDCGLYIRPVASPLVETKRENCSPSPPPLFEGQNKKSYPFKGTRDEWFTMLKEEAYLSRSNTRTNQEQQSCNNPHDTAVAVLAAAYGVNTTTTVLQRAVSLHCHLQGGGGGGGGGGEEGNVVCERVVANIFWLGSFGLALKKAITTQQQRHQQIAVNRRRILFHEEDVIAIANRDVRLDPIFVKRNISDDKASPLEVLTFSPDFKDDEEEEEEDKMMMENIKETNATRDANNKRVDDIARNTQEEGEMRMIEEALKQAVDGGRQRQNESNDYDDDDGDSDLASRLAKWPETPHISELEDDVPGLQNSSGDKAALLQDIEDDAYGYGYAELGITPQKQTTIRFDHNGTMELFYDSSNWRQIEEKIPIDSTPYYGRRIYFVSFFEYCGRERSLTDREKGYGEFVSFPQRVGFPWTSLHSLTIAEEDGICYMIEESCKIAAGEQKIEDDMQPEDVSDQGSSFPISQLSGRIKSHPAFKRLQKLSLRDEHNPSKGPLLILWEYAV